MNRSTLIIAMIAIGAFAAGAYLALQSRLPVDYRVATVFDVPRTLPEFELIDENGNQVDSSRFTERWDILFFGFTHCPDICPATLFQLKTLTDRLKHLDQRRQPRIWLVSVDPQRDTADVLQRYLAHFAEDFNGITGDDDDIAQLAASLGVAYQRIGDGDDYSMSHSAALFILDPSGHYTALFTTPHDMAAIADDYQLLTKQ